MKVEGASGQTPGTSKKEFKEFKFKTSEEHVAIGEVESKKFDSEEDQPKSSEKKSVSVRA